MTWSHLLSRLSLWAAILPAFSLASSALPNVVDLGYVQYQGNLSFSNTVAYLGVPYAEPPLGERRFRAPLPLDTARIAREAKGKVVTVNTNPDFCVQGSTGGKFAVSMIPNRLLFTQLVVVRRLAGEAGGAGSEDCLKVNVYAPAGAKSGDKCECIGTC